jgi:hypothetical protein
MSSRFRFSKNDLLKNFLICAAPVQQQAQYGWLFPPGLPVPPVPQRRRELQETIDQADSRFRL